MADDTDSRSVSIDGLWRNDAGSELDLKQSGTTLTGVYRTRIGAAEHGKDYPLVGWRDRRCIGFSVSWGSESESLTSWTGLIDLDSAGQPIISAMWLLVSATGLKRDGETAIVVDRKPWEAFRTQAVTFKRV